MWRISSPTIKSATLDFTSSGQGRVNVHQLWANDVELMNAQELVELDEEPYQYIVCEECGITHCQPGGWIQYRKTDSIIFLMPAYSSIKDEYDDMGEEYFPPYYIKDKGIGYIDIENYKTQFYEIGKFPNLLSVPKISSWEALKIYQSEAPIRMLGEIYEEPNLRENVVIASSSGNYIELIDVLNELLTNNLLEKRNIEVLPVSSDCNIVTLYLDVPEFSEWRALVEKNGKYYLFLEPGYFINAF